MQGVLNTALFSHDWNCAFLFSQVKLKSRRNKSEETNFRYCYALWFEQSLADLFLLQNKETWNSDDQVFFLAVQKPLLNTKLLCSNKRMHLCLLIFSLQVPTKSCCVNICCVNIYKITYLMGRKHKINLSICNQSILQ